LVLYKDFFLVTVVMGAAKMLVEIEAPYLSGDLTGSCGNSLAVENLLAGRWPIVAEWLRSRRLKGRSRTAVGGRLGRGGE
jgi:hypothetical protein